MQKYNPSTLPEIQLAIAQTFRETTDLAVSLSDEQFHFRPNGEKWSVGQNLEHLILGTMGIASVLGRPKAVFAGFGSPDQPSKSFQDIRDNYFGKNRLFKAPPKVSPDESQPKSKEEVLASWKMIGQKMEERLPANWTEEELDAHCLLHPALGKLTIREILFFMVFHNEHHRKAMELAVK